LAIATPSLASPPGLLRCRTIWSTSSEATSRTKADLVEHDPRGRLVGPEVPVDEVLDDVLVATSAICSASACSDSVKKSANVEPSAHDPVWVPRFRKWARTARAICSSW
jgi:hypothetical protein